MPATAEFAAPAGLGLILAGATALPAGAVEWKPVPGEGGPTGGDRGDRFTWLEGAQGFTREHATEILLGLLVLSLAVAVLFPQLGRHGEGSGGGGGDCGGDGGGGD